MLTSREYTVLLKKTSSSESDDCENTLEKSCDENDIIEVEQKYNKLMSFDKAKELWQCQHCGLWEKVKLNMKAHVERHMSGVLFRCLYCNINEKEFNQKRNLLAHIHVKHTKKLHLTCPFCQRDFINKGLIKKAYVEISC